MRICGYVLVWLYSLIGWWLGGRDYAEGRRFLALGSDLIILCERRLSHSTRNSSIYAQQASRLFFERPLMKLYICKLEQLSESKTGIRTDDVIGRYERPPKVGTRFEMIAAPLDPTADLRYISTSPIEKVLKKSFTPTVTVYDFKTKNTEYRVTTIERK